MCCVCLDDCKINMINCTTCKTTMHISCIIEIIDKSVQYDKCPHCRSCLPSVFTRKINERETKNRIVSRSYPSTNHVLWYGINSVEHPLR